MGRKALFAGMVVTPEGEPVGVTEIGNVPYYVVTDSGFQFHIEAAQVDRQVLQQLGEQIRQHQELVSESVMRLLGQEDLFTKAAIDASIKNLDAALEQLMENGLPEGTAEYLGLLGLRVVLNYHGEVEQIIQPDIAAPEDE